MLVLMVAVVVERVEEAGGDAPRLGDFDFVIMSKLCEGGGERRRNEGE